MTLASDGKHFGGSLVVLSTLVATALLGGAPSSASGDKRAQLRLIPTSGLLDTPIAIEAAGLRPNVQVALKLSARDASGRLWQIRLSARADGRGRLRRDASRSLALLRPPARRISPTMASLIPPPAGLRVRAELLIGSRTAAAATVLRVTRTADVDVRTLTLAGEGIVGRYWSRPDADSGVAVLLLGGSEGGLSGDVTASLLASHGYRTLQLAYFGLEGLPPKLARIPLEYFEASLRWLAGQPGVAPDRVVILGTSRGAEVALLLGTRFPPLVYGVVAYAPSSVVNPALDCASPAWVHAGASVPHVSCDDLGLTNPTRTPEAVIPVEKIRGPIFLVAGGADGVWPSAGYAAAIAERVRANGKAGPTTLIYRRAGHAVGAQLPYLPQATAGGGIVADVRARTDAWFKLLRLLDRS